MAKKAAPEREGRGLEETRNSVLSEWLGARSLTLVPVGQTVLVAHNEVEESARRLGAIGLERGMVVTCESNDDSGVSLRLSTGRRLTVGLRDAWATLVTVPEELRQPAPPVVTPPSFWSRIQRDRMRRSNSRGISDQQP